MKNDLKPEMNKKYNTISAYVLGVSAIIIVFIMMFVYSVPLGAWCSKFMGILSPFFWGFAFAYILCPVCNYFDVKFSKSKLRFWKKHGGMTVTYIIFLLCITLFFYIMIPQIALSFNSFVDTYKDYGKHLTKLFKLASDELKFIPPEIMSKLQGLLTELLGKTTELVTQYSPVVIARVSSFAMGLWKIVLGFIISIYMVAERKTFARQIKKLLYSVFSKKHADRIMFHTLEAHSYFGGFIGGKLLDSLIIGLLCFVGLAILKMPYTPLVSLVVGVTNVIPYFGPFLGAIPSFIIIFFNDPIKALWFALFILVLQQIDGNFIGPKILKQAVGVSSFWVIFSLLIMGGLFGVVGMVIAVPLFALIHAEVSRTVNSVITKKLSRGEIDPAAVGECQQTQNDVSVGKTDKE